MAAKLNELCLQEIFELVSVDKIDDHHRQNLFNCALVNRHWCINAIPILWRNPFPFSSHSGPAFISTLINDQQGSPFIYYRLIKQLNLQLLAEAIQDYLLLSFPTRQDNQSLNIVTSSILKLLCHKLVNTTENVFFELNYHSVENLPMGDWNIYQIPDADTSLRKLRKLSISNVKKSKEILESASRVSPNLSNLKIDCSCFLEENPFEYEELFQLISYIKLFNNLRSLNIHVSIENNGDKILSELGKNLPKTLETLCIEGYFEFSQESLEKFFHGAKGIKFQSLGFPESEEISDKHLETIWKAIYDSSLDISIKKLDVRYGNFVTRNQAKKFQDQGINVE
ncbi:6154_t:CDS:1, partial [Ambispora leptoticha]